MSEFFTTYCVHILVTLLFLAGFLFFILNGRKNIKEWLLYAVVQAEMVWGAKTGKIKLREVYNDFVKAFPIISKIIPFTAFSALVDLALDEMKEILATNEACKRLVEGEY